MLNAIQTLLNTCFFSHVLDKMLLNCLSLQKVIFMHVSINKDHIDRSKVIEINTDASRKQTNRSSTASHDTYSCSVYTAEKHGVKSRLNFGSISICIVSLLFGSFLVQLKQKSLLFCFILVYLLYDICLISRSMHIIVYIYIIQY